nr:hypothetical protein [Tanacetum cinerariifolium]
MELCTKLSDRVLNLETTKTSQAKEIANLKKSVKRLERKRKSRSYGLKRLYKVGLSVRVKSSKEESLGKEDASKQGRKITNIDADEELTLVDETTKEKGRLNAQDEIMFDVNVDLQDITIAGIEETVSTTALIITIVTIDELTLAQARAELKSEKPKADKVVIQEQELHITTTTTAITAASKWPKAKSIVMQETSETPTTTTIPIYLKVQDKGKGIMVEEPLKMKKKDQISFDEQEARRLQAEIDEQDKLAEREAQKALEANIVARFFMEFLKKRRKFFTIKRNEEKRNSPPTKAQQMSIMSTYLKNTDGWNPRNLKNKSFAKIKELFDKAMASSKRAGDEVDQERSKKQKIEDENESVKLKRCLEIALDDGDEVSIDGTPLSSKSLTIVDYKIYKEGGGKLFPDF